MCKISELTQWSEVSHSRSLFRLHEGVCPDSVKSVLEVPDLDWTGTRVGSMPDVVLYQTGNSFSNQ